MLGLHKIELDRLAAAKATARLSGCCSFLLPLQLRYLKQFALPKANYGWVARGPTCSGAKTLWSAFWVSAHRVRYSSPWLRAFFLGGSLHLDVVWVTRLVAVVFPLGLTMVELALVLSGPGSSLMASTWCVLGSGVILWLPLRSIFRSVLCLTCLSPSSVLFNTMLDKVGGLGSGKSILNVVGMRFTFCLSTRLISVAWISKISVLGSCPALWLLRSVLELLSVRVLSLVFLPRLIPLLVRGGVGLLGSGSILCGSVLLGLDPFLLNLPAPI